MHLQSAETGKRSPPVRDFAGGVNGAEIRKLKKKQNATQPPFHRTGKETPAY
jgi:hypothetical protein